MNAGVCKVERCTMSFGFGSELDKTYNNIYRLVSEPGDCTKYDFIVMPFYDDFLIMPFNSTFRVPNRLSKFSIASTIDDYENGIKNIEDAAKSLYSDESINPHTIVQIARAIYEVFIQR